MVQIKKQLISSTPYSHGKNNKRLYITIHETDNFEKGAGAQNHADLQSNGNSRDAAWHYQVDDQLVIQSFDHHFSLWQSGDGSGNGNVNSIAIEICVNPDSDFKKAVENAAELAKKIMKDEGISLGNVVQHNRWSGKNCPRYLRSGSKGVDWADFNRLISGASGSVSAPDNKTKPETVKPTWTKVTGNWTGQTLGNGEYGVPVKQLQEKLAKNDPPFYPNKSAKNNGIDSYYGDETEDAVRRFQSVNGLTVDGLAGKEVYAKLGASKANLKVDGYWGVEVTKALQRYFGTPVDGVISKPSPMIKKLQALLGVKADGLLGPKTYKAMQERFGTPVDGKVSKPSVMVKELQRRLNKGKL